MDSKKVDVTIGGVLCSIKTDEEEAVLKAAELLEERIEEIRKSSSVINTQRNTALAGLSVMMDNIKLNDERNKLSELVDRLTEKLDKIDTA
ncbi:cell division protein ZapA [Limisalsivibrio acetivorans]|uniref:cell division protein ZapA n=1 Tax=Limisalsivibrio acetivorans TaxID=1304888 RepID=UPI00138AF13C|nr:cell division protein ZapA [Limisalsivibrio acetivorans]